MTISFFVDIAEFVIFEYYRHYIGATHCDENAYLCSTFERLNSVFLCCEGFLLCLYIIFDKFGLSVAEK